MNYFGCAETFCLRHTLAIFSDRTADVLHKLGLFVTTLSVFRDPVSFD